MLIDVDQHITEPRDVWTARMSAKKWGGLIPHVEWSDDRQEECWFVGERPVCDLGQTVFWNGPKGEPDRREAQRPKSFTDMHPSSYDAKARLEVLDASDVWATTLYPNVGFGKKNLYTSDSASTLEFQTKAICAYNDFIIEWCSVAPERLIPIAGIPYWDVDAAVREIQRCAELGHKGLVTTGAPQLHDQPYMADRHWDPIWAAAQDAGLSIAFHTGGGDISAQMNEARKRVEGWWTMVARGTVAVELENSIPIVELLMSNVLPRFPRLKFVGAETAIGWVPFALEAADYHFKKYRVDLEHPEYGDALPSDYFRRQAYVSYWFEELTDFHIERIGADSIMFETDYPHPTCLYADEVAQAINGGLSKVAKDVADKILWRNAAELYGVSLPEGV